MQINTGKVIRLKRIFDKNGKAVIFAPVHNLTSPDPYQGQIDVESAVKQSSKGGATAMVMSKGFLRLSAGSWDRKIGILNYLFTYAALSPDPIEQIAISTVEESARIGADGVCFFVGLSTKNDCEVLKLLGKVGDECEKHGLIFAAEAEFPDFYGSREDHMNEHGTKYLKYTGRVCAELGCDFISTNWTGTVDSFAELVDYVKIPVVINGGTKIPEEKFLKMVEDSISAGGSGCLVGRNLSEAKDIEKMTRATAKVIKEGVPANIALKELK